MTRRLRPTVGWGAVLGSGTIAGVGFTVSLLIATLAFHGAELDEAKLGSLTAALLATRYMAGVPGDRDCCRSGAGTRPCSARRAAPRPRRAVDPDRDHIRGPPTRR